MQSGKSTCKNHCMLAEYQSKRRTMRGNRVFSSLSAQYLSDLIINIAEPDGRFQVDFSRGSHCLHISNLEVTGTLISFPYQSVLKNLDVI